MIEFEGLQGEKQGEYLRREGLQSEHIAGWKKSMEAGLEGGGGLTAANRSEWAADQKRSRNWREIFPQGSSVGGDHGAVGAEKKSGLNLGQREEPVSVEDRQSCIEMVEQAKASGARRQASCAVLEVSVRTLERWEKAPEQGDQRRGPVTGCAHALSAQENKPSSRYRVALSIAIYRLGR